MQVKKYNFELLEGISHWLGVECVGFVWGIFESNHWSGQRSTPKETVSYRLRNHYLFMQYNCFFQRTGAGTYFDNCYRRFWPGRQWCCRTFFTGRAGLAGRAGNAFKTGEGLQFKCCLWIFRYRNRRFSGYDT